MVDRASTVEALGLVDHFHFLSRVAEDAHADTASAAVAAGWFLATTGRWAEPYFDANDLHFCGPGDLRVVGSGWTGRRQRFRSPNGI